MIIIRERKTHQYENSIWKINKDDINNLQAFKAELTLRYAMPLNIIGFGIVIAFVIMSFGYQRKENVLKPIIVFGTIILLQIISIVSSNISIKYQNFQILNFFPVIFCLFLVIFFSNRLQKV